MNLKLKSTIKVNNHPVKSYNGTWFVYNQTGSQYHMLRVNNKGQVMNATKGNTYNPNQDEVNTLATLNLINTL